MLASSPLYCCSFLWIPQTWPHLQILALLNFSLSTLGFLSVFFSSWRKPSIFSNLVGMALCILFIESCFFNTILFSSPFACLPFPYSTSAASSDRIIRQISSLAVLETGFDLVLVNFAFWFQFFVYNNILGCEQVIDFGGQFPQLTGCWWNFCR